MGFDRLATLRDLYLRRLHDLPFVQEARIAPPEPADHPHRYDAAIEIVVKGRRHKLLAEEKHVHRLNHALVNAVLQRVTNQDRARHILLTPHVTPGMGEILADGGLNFLDAAGNCHITLGNNLFIHIEGRRPPPLPPATRGLGAPAYRVIFAILARPDLLKATARDLAANAGVGKTTAAATVARLEEEGLLLPRRAPQRIARLEELIERWAIGYADTLRPKLLVGHYRTPLTIDELRRRIETYVPGQEVPPPRWAWGGGGAAFRLTGHYRGPTVVIHVDGPAMAMLNAVHAIPAREAQLTVIGAPGPLAFEGPQPHVAHPLLVYAELLTENTERAREAARLVRERFLKAGE